MKFEWKIKAQEKELKVTEEFDSKKILQGEQQDSARMNYLLDAKLFEQIRKMKGDDALRRDCFYESGEDEEMHLGNFRWKEAPVECRNLVASYLTAQKMLEDVKGDLTMLKERDWEADQRPFEREVEQFIDEVGRQLASREELSARQVQMPDILNGNGMGARREQLYQNFEDIRTLLELDYRDNPDGTDNQQNAQEENLAEQNLPEQERRRIRWQEQTRKQRKDYIRACMRKIPELMGEEYEESYVLLDGLRKVYTGRAVSEVQVLKMVVHPNLVMDTMDTFETALKTEAEEVLSSVMDVTDLTDADRYQEKKEKLDSYMHKQFMRVQEYNRNKKKLGPDGQDAVAPGGGKFRKYYSSDSRCFGVMEFPNGGHDGMFALSGVVDYQHNPGDDSFERAVVDPLRTDLPELQQYIWCRLTGDVKRYRHRKADGTSEPLQQNRISQPYCQDPDASQNDRDYSCCERKMLAVLEQESAMQHVITLLTRWAVCDLCEPAVDAYEAAGGTVIRSSICKDRTEYEAFCQEQENQG